MNETEEIIKKQWGKMSPEVKKALATSGWQNKIIELGKKYELHVDQMGLFRQETMLVLVGLTHPDDFEDEIEDNLGLKPEIAKQLADEAAQTIFPTIREKLKEVYQKGERETDEEDSLNKTEQSILRKTGIEIAGDDGSTPETSDEGVPEPDMNSSEVLAGIEHPAPNAPLHPFEQKLAAPTVNEKKEAEYTKQTAPDPYREMPS